MSRGSSLEQYIQARPEGPLRVVDGKGFALGLIESLTGRACDARNRGDMVRVRGATATDPDIGYVCEWTGAAYAWQGFTLAANDARYVNVSGDTMTGDLDFTNAMIDFNDVVGEKISLFGTASYGIGIEASELRIATGGATVLRTGGYAGTERFRVGTTEAVFNDVAGDYNVRIEGDAATNLLVTDAGLDAVQIGTTVAGAIASFSSTAIVLNEAGGDIDVRMEGNTDPNAFVLDAGANTVSIPNLKSAASGFRVQDNGDPTKQIAFSAFGITTATTRTYTAPNADGTLGLFTQSQGLTIAAGVVTTTLLTPIIHLSIDTEAAAASDTLDTINGGIAGQIAVVKSAASTRDVIIGDGTGNLRTAGAFTLDTSNDTITFIWTGAVWTEISRANND